MQRAIHNVLLNPAFWERAAGDKSKLKQIISNYMRVSYPNYELKKVVKNGDSYMGVCERKV